jgi:universal stress protein A
MKRENDKQPIRARPRQLIELATPASFAAGDAVRAPRRVILHPTDYSEISRQAFELACRLALDRGSRLLVMHVAEPVRVSSLGMAPLPPLPKGYRGAWESRLRLLRPADPNVQVEHRLEEGDVAAAILRVACEAPCDLIVMGSRERTWLGRLLTSSVAEEVGRKAPCPVLTLKSERPGEVIETVRRDSKGKDAAKLGAILHATDFSQPARYGFELARSRARESGSELIVAHVAPIPALRRMRGYREKVEGSLQRMTKSHPM